ncbi:nucleoside triphosphate pyrophosphohydrolase [Natranaerofaba carboxydovora]|uniref:nucleoside triphosphate pyrophosphohydrolase n=1 Tax=Natranaerofaba carboxydovora TaxID=2742683 RepID=UPI001F12AF01|nr:nucleoside triphosphate pyrophosphohydrolase [Natranaerofaba carboxydovora]UMZ74367.1 hypothetical protein ACONDI_01955 [Natranaerofaba carboxydovora]
MREETKYNKLIRDKIPEIIEKQGKIAETTVIESEKEYRTRLMAKLKEEVMEYYNSGDPDEIADILEVLYTLIDKVHNMSVLEIEKTRLKKQKERGGFEKRLVLKRVWE